MIIDDINSQILEDYKSGNEAHRVILQTIKASLQNKQKELGEKYSIDDEHKILKNELKQRKEALDQFKNAGRDDLVEKNQNEIDIIERMVPQDLPGEEIEKIVKEKLSSLEDRSFGSVMKAAMVEINGRADGRVVSEIVKKNLP